MLPMRREVTVEGVRVTLVDANHCPGAVQILFLLPDGRRFLHCGDMRYHPSMQQVRALTPTTLKEGVYERRQRQVHATCVHLLSALLRAKDPIDKRKRSEFPQ